MGNAVRKPIETDQDFAGVKAAFERIRSVEARPTLVEVIDDDLWKAEGAEEWNINAGSEAER